MSAFAIWCAALAAAMLAPALLFTIAPDRAARLLTAFPRSRPAAWLLSAIAWAGAAREIERMNIDVFDAFLNRFPGEPWILGAVLCILCIFFLPDLLPIRAASGILMLFPTPLLAVTRVVESDWRLAPVVFAYICLTAGMVFMFYPWHARRIMAWIAQSRRRIKACGAAAAAVAAILLIAAACAGCK